jgi:hypothetical protein
MIAPKQNPLAGCRLICLSNFGMTLPFKEAPALVPLSANGALVDSPPVTLSAQPKPKAARPVRYKDANGKEHVDLAAIFDNEAERSG